MKPGRYSGMPEQQYFALDAVNSSKLKLVGRSPAHCKAGEQADPKETEALRLGRLIHCAVLEPGRLAEAYCVKPDPDNYPGALTDLASYKVKANLLGLKVSGTKAVLKARILEADPGAMFWDDIQTDSVGGRQEFKQDQWEIQERIVAAIEDTPSAKAALSGGVAEEVVVWEDPVTMQMCKSRMDYYREDIGVVLDLKTCDDARPAAVQRAIMKYGYHRSAAHYLNGLRAMGLPGDDFAWIFVEKSPPHAIGMYFAAPEMIYAGEDDMRRHLNLYSYCMDTGNWPAYSENFETINLPEWAQE
jgi:exodeoxyribonuclease VIII